MGHLSPEELIDVAEGARSEASAPHLWTCVACRQQLAELREMITAVESDAGVPEPSPLFWDHLSARVGEAIAAEPRASASWRSFGPLSWSLAGALSVAVVAIAVSLTIGTTPRRIDKTAPTITTSDTAADAGAVSAADDPSLSLLADLAGSLDWDIAADTGITMEVGTADGTFPELNDAERVELRRLLREAMARPGA
jgi:hypothetical protein